MLLMDVSKSIRSTLNSSLTVSDSLLASHRFQSHSSPCGSFVLPGDFVLDLQYLICMSAGCCSEGRSSELPAECLQLLGLLQGVPPRRLQVSQEMETHRFTCYKKRNHQEFQSAHEMCCHQKNKE